MGVTRTRGWLELRSVLLTVLYLAQQVHVSVSNNEAIPLVSRDSDGPGRRGDSLDGMEDANTC